MLRAGKSDKDGHLIVAGLSEQNIERLKSGQPIYADLNSFNTRLRGNLLITYGPTEADIAEDLERYGIVSQHAVGVVDPKLEAHTNLIAQHEKILICTVGFPRSGKSTWAKSQAWPIVCPDSVRLAIHGQPFIYDAEGFVWATVRAMVRALFISGHKIVILDACNNTRKRRDEWKNEKWTTFFKVVEAPIDDCIVRAKQNPDLEQMMKMIETINRMAEDHQPLMEDEKAWP